MNLIYNKAHSWSEQRASFWIILGLALIVCVCGFVGGVYIELARGGAVVALASKVIVELRDGQKRFLTSPLFLLSVIGVLFFSVVQGIWAPQPPWPTSERNIALYVGSKAEAVVLAFCMAALMFYQVMSIKIGAEKLILVSNQSNFLVYFLFLMTLSISAFDIGIYYLKISGFEVPTLFSKSHFVVPPLLILSLCFLIRNSLISGWVCKICLFFLVGAVLVGLIYVGESKVAVFIMASLLLYVFRLFDFSFRNLIVISLISLLVVLSLLQVVQNMRWKVSVVPDQISTKYSEIFIGKGVRRQTETGYCLGHVIKIHAQEPFEMSEHFFWVKGLIPRAFWPNKPNLSLGKEYAMKYCSRRTFEIGHHSASITLLGQPIIKGGIWGLVFHVGILLFALAIVETFNANRAALSTTLVVALLPWLIDFDQDFAMYVANAVKFTLVMLILFVPMVLIEHYNGAMRK